MPDELASELRKVKNELKTCKRQLKDVLAFNERLRSAIGYKYSATPPAKLDCLE
jgi:hypothetical protein